MQESATSTSERRAGTDPRDRALSFDALGDMTRNGELRDLYRRGEPPPDLAELDGDPAGRVVSIHGLGPGASAQLIRRMTSAESFPWEGKSFRAESSDHGFGVNRVRLGGRYKLFEFRTRIASSRLDGDPTIVLDYELPENPSPVQLIHDEIREVDDGLYLGPGMWKGETGTTLLLWFALDTALQMPFSTGIGP